MAKDIRYELRLSVPQKSAYLEAAKLEDMTLAEWITDCCDRNLINHFTETLELNNDSIMKKIKSISKKELKAILKESIDEEMESPTVVRAGKRVKREYGALLKPEKGKK